MSGKVACVFRTAESDVFMNSNGSQSIYLSNINKFCTYFRLPYVTLSGGTFWSWTLTVWLVELCLISVPEASFQYYPGGTQYTGVFQQQQWVCVFILPTESEKNYIKWHLSKLKLQSAEPPQELQLVSVQRKGSTGTVSCSGATKIHKKDGG